MGPAIRKMLLFTVKQKECFRVEGFVETAEMIEFIHQVQSGGLKNSESLPEAQLVSE